VLAALAAGDRIVGKADDGRRPEAIQEIPVETIHRRELSMSKDESPAELAIAREKACSGCCSSSHPVAGGCLSRRDFLQRMGAAGVALGGGTALAAEVRTESSERTPGQPFPRGAALRVKPILVYAVPKRKDKASWRSYGDIRRGLSTVGVDLLWITDGTGYKTMQKSLRDAYVILPNIYNLSQAEQHLGADLIAVLKT